MHHTLLGSRRFFRLLVFLSVALLVSCAARHGTVPAPSPGNEVAGRVISAADKPLADVTVYLVVAGGSAGDRLLARSVTNYLGQFSFTDPILWYDSADSAAPEKAQRYYVFASSPEHGFSFATILKDDRYDSLSIRLVRAEFTKVKVTDQNGKPVRGAQVYYAGGGISEADAPHLDSAHRWSHLESDVGISSELTDANGEVTLPGLYDGSIWRASKPGFASSTGSSLITLLPGTRLFGTVTYADGTPASNAVVRCTYGGRSFWEQQTVTDDLGRYAFDDAPIPPKPTADDPSLSPSYALEVSKADSPFVTAATTRPSDRLTRFDLHLQRACIVSGKVIDERTHLPLAGIRLSAKSLPAGHDVYSSEELTTDAEGRFQASVPSGTQLLLQWQDSPTGKYLLDREWMKTQPGEYASVALHEGRIASDKTNIILPLRLATAPPLARTAGDVGGKPGAVQAAARMFIDDLLKDTVDPSDPALSNGLKPTTRDGPEALPATRLSNVAATRPAVPTDSRNRANAGRGHL